MVRELTVESLVPGGDGLARHEGKVVFIPDVLPGEKVRVRIVQSKRDFERGEVIELLEASPDRIVPECPAWPSCGGCDWLHIAYPAQRALKIEMARETYRRLGGFDFPGLQLEWGQPWHYRNRIQVHRDPEGKLGFMGRKSSRVFPLRQCPVSHGALQEVFQSPSRDTKAARFLAFGHDYQGRPEVFREDAFPTMPDNGREQGIRTRILNREIRFPLGGFFQSNIGMLEKLIPWALEGLSGERALDLYSGVGVFAAFLSEKFSKVLALEEQALAAQWISTNVGSPVEVFTGKVEELTQDSRLQSWADHPDLILVDPPRVGLHADARRFLTDAGAKNLIYVACDISTQARDLKILLAGGYRLVDLRLFDFYPQTHHLEAVAKLVH